MSIVHRYTQEQEALMEFNSALPIYLQVVTAIKREIVTGRIALGEKLPSGRDLALLYTINPNTASRVYKELESAGICFTRRGLGTFVSEDPDLVKRLREEMAQELLEQFLEGMKNLGISREEAVELIRKGDF